MLPELAVLRALPELTVQQDLPVLTELTVMTVQQDLLDRQGLRVI